MNYFDKKICSYGNMCWNIEVSTMSLFLLTTYVSYKFAHKQYDVSAFLSLSIGFSQFYDLSIWYQYSRVGEMRTCLNSFTNSTFWLSLILGMQPLLITIGNVCKGNIKLRNHKLLLLHNIVALVLVVNWKHIIPYLGDNRPYCTMVDSFYQYFPFNEYHIKTNWFNRPGGIGVESLFYLFNLLVSFLSGLRKSEIKKAIIFVGYPIMTNILTSTLYQPWGSTWCLLGTAVIVQDLMGYGL